MKHSFTLLSTVSILTLLLFKTNGVSSQDKPEYKPNQVIIKFRETVQSRDVLSLRENLKASVLQRFSIIGAELWEISDISVEDAVKQYNKDPRIQYIEPNYRVSLVGYTPNDQFYNQLWALHNTGQTGGTPDADIDAPEAWKVQTGDSVVVGVIDTGVDWLHPDLAGNIWVNRGEIPGNGIDDDANGYIDDIHGWDFVNDDNNPFDDHGHGTHVSGTIAAIGNNGIGVAGVSWSARIMCLKFLSAGGSGWTDDAILSIQYAIQMGAKLTSNSWGGYFYSQALYDAIQAAGNAGQLFIAAAGNDASNNDRYPVYPTSYDLDNIISVASTDHKDRRSSFSNWGPVSVDLGAPGSSILSTLPGNRYGTYSGTSMAAPHVSGVVSLVWSEYPNLTHLQVKQRIMDSVDKISSLSGKVVSGGRLNAFRAVSTYENIPPATIVDLATLNPTSNSITLTWTASGDDGNIGRAAVYDIRYSNAPINSTNFNNAIRVSGVPRPKPAGSVETFKIRGLNFNTTYYFAIKVFDEWGNSSGVSNSPSGTTLGIPDIAIYPTSLNTSLFTGQVNTANIIISNQGSGILDFFLPDYGGSAAQMKYYTLPPITISGNAADTDKNESGKTYAQAEHKFLNERVEGFTSLLRNLTGKRIGLAIESHYNIISSDLLARGASVINVTFPITPTVLNSLDVLAFDDVIRNLSATDINTIRTWVQNGKAILVQGDDFNSVTNINSLLTGTGILDTVIGNYSDEILTDIHAHPTTIDVDTIYARSTGAYLTVSSPAKTIVYDNLSRSHIAVSKLGSGKVIAAANEVCEDFNLTVGDTRLFVNRVFDWLISSNDFLSVSPTSGSISAGNSIPITVTFNAYGMDGGNYYDSLKIISNDPDESSLKVPLHLNVTGAPDIALSKTLLDFDSVFVGFPASEKIVISNNGTEILTVSDIFFDNQNFTVDITNFSLEPGKRQNVIVTLTPSSIGEIRGTLTITNNDPDEGSVTVSLKGEGILPPNISVAPESLSDSLLSGEQSSQTLTITNTGFSNLKVRVGFERILDSTISEMRRSRFSIINKGELNQLQSKTETPKLAGVYTGTHLSFGISDYGEIMPFQFPVGREHLRVGWLFLISGYTLAYVSNGIDQVALATYGYRSGIEKVAYREIENSSTKVIVEVEVKTRGDELKIIRQFVFYKEDKFVNVKTFIVNMSQNTIDRVVFKEYADWDVDGNFYNNWGYDPERFMIYAYRTNYVTIVPAQEPSVMDVYGWDDYWQRHTNGNAPPGNYTSYDGLALLHFELGDIGPNNFKSLENAYAAASSLVELQATVDKSIGWLRSNVNQATIPPDSSLEVKITFDANWLFSGNYSANIVITSNDPDENTIKVPVRLNVTGVPDIAVSVGQLYFGKVCAPNSRTIPIWISNRGTDILTIHNIGFNIADYNVNLSSFNLEPFQQQQILVTFAPSDTGERAGALTITSDDPDSPLMNVEVRGLSTCLPVGFRTITYDSFALAIDGKGKMKAIKKKSDKVHFKFDIVNDTTFNQLSLFFSMDARGIITKGTDTLARFFGRTIAPITLLVTRGDTIQITGVGVKPRRIKVKYAWGNTKKKNVQTFKLNQPVLPMPNAHNIGEEVYSLGGFGATGMVVGIPNSWYGSVVLKTYKDVMKSLKDLSGLHKPPARCFYDFYKRKNLPPSKHSNILFADAVALKLNIAASELGITPPGLGQLKYWEPGHRLDGLTINTISAMCDVFLSKCGEPASITAEILHDVIKRINEAFSGKLDTVTFADKLELTPVRSVSDFPWLEYDPSIPPVIRTPMLVESNEVPENYILFQNYPNPFNPVTTISFSLPEISVVTLKIYNILGQEVATLLNGEEMDDGEHEIDFDASNLSSGVYFYRINAESIEEESSIRFTQVKKMLLIR